MNESLKDFIFAALFTAFIAVSAMITVPLGPIPFTLQTFAITLVMFIAKPKVALLSMVIYILLGAIGAPIFSSMKGGIGVLMGPTGGFLIGYLLGIFPVGLAMQKLNEKSSSTGTKIAVTIVSGIVLTLIAYVIGTVQFMVVMNQTLAVALAACVIPFMLIDLAKIIVAWILLALVKKHLN